MIQGIGNTNLGLSKLNFGAQDVSQANVGVVNPSPVSNDPYKDRYGYMENDLYGLKSNNSDMAPLLTRPNMDVFPGVTDVHDGEKSRTAGSILKPVITLGLLAGGAALLIKKGKKIKLKNIFNKTPKVPEEINNFKNFNKYYDDVQGQIDKDGINEINVPERIRMILDGKEDSEIREFVGKAYSLAKTYAKKGKQPKIKLLFDDNTSKEQVDHIMGKLKKGEIMSSAYLDKIEVFEIVQTGKNHTEIAIQKDIMRSTDVDNIEDKAQTILDRAIKMFRYP